MGDPLIPSEAVKAGRCPMCGGTGRTDSALRGDDVECSGCGGTGALDDLWRRLDDGLV